MRSVSELLDTAFNAESIAVVGASNSPAAFGYYYMRYFLEYGYPGKIYPVNPRYEEILGIRAYPSVKDIPEKVDYVICCTPAQGVPELLYGCAEKGVKIMHLFTARMRETGSKEVTELEEKIARLAKELNIRFIGPNCMGIYYPKRKIAFGFDFPLEPGKLGMLSQSGGLATVFTRIAAQRGLRFSKVISYGNATDINEVNLFEYLLQDEETEVIAAYIEGTTSGRKLYEVLKKVTSVKPVIILKAGRTKAGARAASSHTASISGSTNIWEVGIRGAGAIEVKTIDEMLDILTAFYFLGPASGKRVGVFGGSGGQSVISADEWGEEGFELTPLPSKIQNYIRQNIPPMWWKWLMNPMDISILPETDFSSPKIFKDLVEMTIRSSEFDLIVYNITTCSPFPLEAEMPRLSKCTDIILNARKKEPKPIVAIVDSGYLGIEDLEGQRWRFLAEQKSHLIEAGIPVYPSMCRAARAIRKLIDYHQLPGNTLKVGGKFL
jgi:acetyltransferase